MPTIRPYRADDLEALYDICLKTGDAGQDASHLYRDPKSVGNVYAAPYGVLEPQTCWVAQDEAGVGAYIIGTRDTHRFEKRLDAEWWPRVRESLDPDLDGADARMAHIIRNPSKTPRRINEPYPAHLHIDCLPRMQGIGLGKRLIDTFLGAMRDAGVPAVHLGVGPRNARAVRFYERYGFHLIEQLPEPWNTMWFGISSKG
jgi:ribosomal protein S18 acetylase RimI-like enzyme